MVGPLQHNALPQACGDAILSALFRSSAVGVAIFDRQLRFRAINDALASMNGIPAAAHIGKTIHAVLGSAAEKIQPAYERVFSTGRPLADFEVAAKLPSRTAPGRWNESYFPIKDEAGQVQHVGVIVLELTRRKYLEASVLRLSDKLTLIGSALRRPADELEPAIAPGAGESRGDLFVRALGLLESCLSDARDISQLLSVGPPITVVDTFQLSELSSAPVPPSEQRQEPLYSQRVEGPGSLSAREREITAYLASGKTNKQIAAMLAISTRTVESHRARVMLKLDLHSLSDLVRYALRRKLIPS